MTASAKGVNQKDIPAMATTSLKEVLDTFRAPGENPAHLITELRARASDVNPRKPDVNDSVLGFEGWKAWTQALFSLNYVLEFDDNGVPLNPLDSTNVDKIRDALKDLGLEDAAVSRVRVLLRDPEIGNKAGNGEDLWHMTMISDSVDSERERDKIKEHDRNIALIEQEGFKYRVLNCRELIDRKQELTLPRTQLDYVIKWSGKTFAGMKSEKPSIVRRIKDEHMGEFGLRKVYGPGQEDSIVLLSVSR